LEHRRSDSTNNDEEEIIAKDSFVCVEEFLLKKNFKSRRIPFEEKPSKTSSPLDAWTLNLSEAKASNVICSTPSETFGIFTEPSEACVLDQGEGKVQDRPGVSDRGVMAKRQLTRDTPEPLEIQRL
jgi:hypothetical protein